MFLLVDAGKKQRFGPVNTQFNFYLINSSRSTVDKKHQLVRRLSFQEFLSWLLF